jgi:predicted DNA-binding transcriptional regulator AlpA
MANQRQERPTVELCAFTVAEFCKAHRISKAFFYRLLKDDAGPRVVKVGRRTLVTVEAAAEWRNSILAATAA